MNDRKLIVKCDSGVCSGMNRCWFYKILDKTICSYCLLDYKILVSEIYLKDIRLNEIETIMYINKKEKEVEMNE
jgi:hypothetical protein